MAIIATIGHVKLLWRMGALDDAYTHAIRFTEMEPFIRQAQGVYERANPPN